MYPIDTVSSSYNHTIAYPAALFQYHTQHPMIAMEPYQEKPLKQFSPIHDFLFVNECDENGRDSILAMLDCEQNVYFQALDYSQHVQKSGITYDIRNRIAEWIFEVSFH